MDSAETGTSVDVFSYRNLADLVEDCIKFYRRSLEKAKGLSNAHEKRIQLSRWIRKFHQECGTINSNVEEAIDRLENGSCLFLMSAHQPNLFAYSGVFRKATLNHVLAEKLSEKLNVPVVSFFGIADQDFTDDRWVKSAILPAVERRKGELELRFRMPEKLMLNKVAKPSRQVLDVWRSKIENWFNSKLSSIKRYCVNFGVEFNFKDGELTKNFEEFWGIVEDAYKKAETYADFNAFIMSKIVNEAWGYDTLFSRFSECQQIFEHDFCFLLSRFDEYSRYVREATFSLGNQKRGVYEQEYKTIPFWYHCSCGSKARLMAEQEGNSLIGHGECLRCGKEYKIDFSSKNEPEISNILTEISARSLTMPLTFLEGLKVCCYVGGLGGKEYLQEAKYVADHVGILFPPIAIWRPADLYLGVGQLEALMTYRKFSGTFDLSRYSAVVSKLREKVDEIEEETKELKLQKRSVENDAELKEEEKIERIKAVSVRQMRIRKESNYPVLVSNLKLLENVKAVMRLYPCIVDCAVNVGLKATSDQWVAFLKNDGSLISDVTLQTVFGSPDDYVEPGLLKE